MEDELAKVKRLVVRIKKNRRNMGNAEDGASCAGVQVSSENQAKFQHDNSGRYQMECKQRAEERVQELSIKRDWTTLSWSELAIELVCHVRILILSFGKLGPLSLCEVVPKEGE